MTIGAPTALEALDISLSTLLVFVGAFAVSIVGAKIGIAYCIDRYREFFSGAAYRWTMRCLSFLLLILAGQFGYSGLTTLLAQPG